MCIRDSSRIEGAGEGEGEGEGEEEAVSYTHLDRFVDEFLQIFHNSHPLFDLDVYKFLYLQNLTLFSDFGSKFF